MCSAIRRPPIDVSGTGWVSPWAAAASLPSHMPLSQMRLWTQSVQATPLASPQARITPRLWFAGSDRLYIRVRVPVHEPGMSALPSRPSQLGPPSQDRSSQTALPAVPSSMLPQAMPSTSDTCSTIRRPLCTFVATGKVSWRASDGSRRSQKTEQTTGSAAAAGPDGASGVNSPATRTITSSAQALLSMSHLSFSVVPRPMS